jgi:hypothetical protein
MSLIVGDPTLFGQPRPIGVKSGDVSVVLIEKEKADRIIRDGHYSGSVVWSSSLHLGVYLADDLIGAMQFGPAMNPASGNKIVADSTVDSWLELNRLWLTDDKPPNTTSRAVSGALRLVRHLRPKVEWIQSFADERCGKNGGIYQACSFLYCGSHTATFYDIDGVWVHHSVLHRKAIDIRGFRSGPKVAWAKQNRERAVPHTFRQFRYIKFLNKRAQRRLLLPVLPYPKPDLMVS